MEKSCGPSPPPAVVRQQQHPESVQKDTHQLREQGDRDGDEERDPGIKG